MGSPVSPPPTNANDVLCTTNDASESHCSNFVFVLVCRHCKTLAYYIFWVGSLMASTHAGSFKSEQSFSIHPFSIAAYPILDPSRLSWGESGVRPEHVASLSQCLWTVGGSQSTWRAVTQVQGEHANPTQKGPKSKCK